LFLLFALGALRIKTEVILSDLFPKEHPYLLLQEKFAKIFGGGGSGVVVCCEGEKKEIFSMKPQLTKIRK